MISILNKKVVICFLFLISLLGFILFFLKKYDQFQERSKEFVVYFKGLVDPNVENESISAKNSTLLMTYYSRNGSPEKEKFWNQICLFYNFEYCVEFSYNPGLREKDKENRQKRYKENVIDYSFITNDNTISLEEKNCYLIYYKTQDNMEIYKKEFLKNYPSCKDYYYKHQPLFKDFETKFLKMFE